MSRGKMTKQRSAGSSSGDESVQRARTSSANGGQPDIVAAIDIGSTYSGYAFGLTSDLNEDITNIYINKTWISGNPKLTTVKTPTTVLFTPEKRYHSFGYEAEWKYGQLTADKVNTGWFYFRRFKMAFMQEENLNTTTSIQDDTGKPLRAALVMSAVLKAMRSHLIDALAATMKGVSVDWINENFMIRWVLPHPSTYPESALNFMRMAARQASISDPVLVAEPECASMYCQISNLHRINTRNGETICVQKQGLQYILVDLGGGSVDTSIYNFGEDDRLMELHKTSGEVFGGLRVDGFFVEFLMKVISFEVMDKFAQNFKSDLLTMHKEFETKKRTFDPNLDDYVMLKLPQILRRIYEVNAKQPITVKVDHSEFGDLVQMQGDYIQIDPDIVRGFFNMAGDEIITHVSKVLSTKIGRNIHTMVLTGGFAQSACLQRLFRRKFPSMTILMPEDPEIATMKGAVLYGHELKPIVEMKAKYSYGVAMAMPFIRDEHMEEKRFHANKVTLCTDLFGVHIKLNEIVRIGDLCTTQLLYINRPKQKFLSVPVYLSSTDEPQYTSDRESFYLGRVQISLASDRDRKAPIVVKMGLTFFELIVEVTDQSNGRKVKDTFLDRPPT